MTRQAKVDTPIASICVLPSLRQLVLDRDQCQSALKHGGHASPISYLPTTRKAEGSSGKTHIQLKVYLIRKAITVRIRIAIGCPSSVAGRKRYLAAVLMTAFATSESNPAGRSISMSVPS